MKTANPTSVIQSRSSSRRRRDLPSVCNKSEEGLTSLKYLLKTYNDNREFVTNYKGCWFVNKLKQIGGLSQDRFAFGPMRYATFVTNQSNQFNGEALMSSFENKIATNNLRF